MMPVEVFNKSPPGRPEAEKLVGLFNAVTWWLNGDPIVALAVAELVITGFVVGAIVTATV